MKSTTAGMDTALADTSVKLARVYYILREDGTEHRFTDHDQELVLSGYTGVDAPMNGTYTPVASPSPTRIETNSELRVDSMETAGPFRVSTIEEDDVDQGRFENAQIYIAVVNWSNLANGMIRLKRGYIGEARRGDMGYELEVRGRMQALYQEPTFLVTAECRHDLGDGSATMPGCHVLLAPATWAALTDYDVRDDQSEFPSVNPTAVFSSAGFNWRAFVATVAGTSGATPPPEFLTAALGDTFTDGSVTWKTIRSRQVMQLNLSAHTAPVWEYSGLVGTGMGNPGVEYFTNGVLEITGGGLPNIKRTIKSWNDATGVLTLYRPIPFDLPAFTAATMYVGCKKTVEDCRDKFDNIRNFGGFPHLPGQDSAFGAVK